MKLKFIAACLTLACTAPLPAFAQGRPCGDRDAIVDHLRDRFGEERVSAGLSASNGILEVFVSATTGSWTILVTTPAGQTCLVAAGEAWENAPLPAGITGQPA
ncbi:hypothetical protein HMH01_00615 [Halovulum dunhuangense]|uniref:Uncharacterized protein n=1 Tax=Halovulum dunhuangense TaxID=1505036 RepID=A0A849KX09_9RHOB|nr:hypothetical protein [Halovulum dunhuangense]NNU78927.1 hypothetical protein [Halovulum dunhuangense]